MDDDFPYHSTEFSKEIMKQTGLRYVVGNLCIVYYESTFILGGHINREYCSFFYRENIHWMWEIHRKAIFFEPILYKIEYLDKYILKVNWHEISICNIYSVFI